MTGFIIWCVFLLMCTVAVPVAAMLGKRGQPKLEDAFVGEEFGDPNEAVADVAEVADAGMPEGGGDVFGGEPVAATDDFSAFDEVL